MIKYSQLNPAQKEAVISNDKHLRIIAGAGSGKTRVLTMRIAYLIEQMGVRPNCILAITFTNKAAKEMKKRVIEMLGDEGTGTFISTIHSLCMRILSEDITYLNYPRNFTVIDQDDQKMILKEAYKEINIDKKDYPYGPVLDYISNNKSADVTPEEALKMAYGEPRTVNKAKVYEYYQKRLAAVYGLDFDDLILWTLRLFKSEERVLEKWSRRFHYIHVDEFQDVDSKQYELICLLSRCHDNIYVVGDPDQTIYTWRGADVNIIMNFEKDFKDTKTIVLNENYRSTNNILSGANSVIRHNTERIKKDLFSNNGDGIKIQHKTLGSEAAEANYVTNQVIRLHNDGLNYSQMAVLYRSNYLSREVEKALIENRIPYIIYGGLRFYERMEVKDILSYLRLVVKGDDLAFKRVINQPKRGIGQKSIDAIFDLAENNGITMYEAVKNGLYAKNSATLENFVRMIEKWRDDLNKVELDVLLQEVLDDSGYRAMLEKDNETERLENIKSLIDDITEYKESYPESTLEDYLMMISLYTDRANMSEEDALNLMTIHAAKGLEFDVVFVVGLSEGIFPSERTIAEGKKGVEEERRLAYVAYTRARKELYLTDSEGFSFATNSSKTRSRFITEIDGEYIEHLNEHPKKSTIFDEEVVSFKPKQVSTATANSSIYRTGDVVIHKMFGEGRVVAVAGSVLSIAFSSPHGIKKIFANHPSIRKKTKNDFS